jgi:serine/threonine-protein kinase
VLDFGIARVRETLASGGLSTGSGVLLGTPAFMAPEQAMGKASDIDARADVWAMGATLFAMMSGLTVHEGDSGRELLVKLVTLPTRSLLEVVPEMPTALAEVVDRALDVDRENRWPSAADMRDALDSASRSLWQERPPRAVLAALAESLVPETAPSVKAFLTPEGQKRSVPAAAPTLRAQEHSNAPKPAVETARAVSHSGSAPHPRRRVSLAILIAVLGLGIGIAAIAAVMVRARDDSPSPSAQGVAPLPSPAVFSAAPVASPSLPAASETALDVAPPPAAIAAPDAGRSARSRGAKPEHETPASAGPSPAAQTPSSSPVAASTSAELPAPARSAAPNCNPPYYYDSKMNRVFKKECL